MKLIINFARSVMAGISIGRINTRTIISFFLWVIQLDFSKMLIICLAM